MMYRVDAKIQAFAFIVFMSSCLATETVGLKLWLNAAPPSYVELETALLNNSAPPSYAEVALQIEPQPGSYESMVIKKEGKGARLVLDYLYPLDEQYTDSRRFTVSRRKAAEIQYLKDTLKTTDHAVFLLLTRKDNTKNIYICKKLLPIFLSSRLNEQDEIIYYVTGLEVQFMNQGDGKRVIDFIRLATYSLAAYSITTDIPGEDLTLSQDSFDKMKEGYVDTLIPSGPISSAMLEETLDTIEKLENSTFLILKALGKAARAKFELMKKDYVVNLETESFPFEHMDERDLENSRFRVLRDPDLGPIVRKQFELKFGRDKKHGPFGEVETRRFEEMAKLNASRVRPSWNKWYSRLRHNGAKVFKKSSSSVQNVGPSESSVQNVRPSIDVTSDARPGVVHVSNDIDVTLDALNTAIENAEQNFQNDKSGNAINVGYVLDTVKRLRSLVLDHMADLVYDKSYDNEFSIMWNNITSKPYKDLDGVEDLVDAAKNFWTHRMTANYGTLEDVEERELDRLVGDVSGTPEDVLERGQALSVRNPAYYIPTWDPTFYLPLLSVGNRNRMSAEDQM